MNDRLDLHETLQLSVVRKDGHYDALYHKDHQTYDIERFRNLDTTCLEYMDYIQRKKDNENFPQSIRVTMDCCERPYDGNQIYTQVE
jgi:hypothetical protein